jgi:purine-binding chemotaxis protein CheW
VPTQRQFCTFLLDGRWYGVDIHDVREILPSQSMTPVPLASRLVAGLINLRGQILPVIDLRACLLLPQRLLGQTSMHIVVSTRDEPISLLVDAALGVYEANEAAFEAPPATVDGPALELLRGMYKSPDRLLHILDIQAIIDKAIRTRDENFSQ